MRCRQQRVGQCCCAKPAVSRCRNRPRPSISHWSTRRRAAKVIRTGSKPLIAGSAIRFVSCWMSWAAFRRWVKSTAHSAMAVSTSISTVARWSAPLSAGARARAVRARSGWCTARCCWITSANRWSRRSIASMRPAVWSSGFAPRATSPCMRSLPRLMHWSGSTRCIASCWQTCSQAA